MLDAKLHTKEVVAMNTNYQRFMKIIVCQTSLILVFKVITLLDKSNIDVLVLDMYEQLTLCYNVFCLRKLIDSKPTWHIISGLKAG